jgi:hypothetical protein
MTTACRGAAPTPTGTLYAKAEALAWLERHLFGLFDSAPGTRKTIQTASGPAYAPEFCCPFCCQAAQKGQRVSPL